MRSGLKRDRGRSFRGRQLDVLACQSSQREWLRKRHGMDDHIATMECWTRACGTWGRLEFAEGFRRYKNHPYPQTPLLEELLAGYIHKICHNRRVPEMRFKVSRVA